MIWFRFGSFALVATCFIHLIGHFSGSTSANDTERQLIDLMKSYISPNTHTSMMSLFNGFSLFFALFFLMTGELNLWLARAFKNNLVELKKVAVVNVIGLGIGLGISLYYFFWAPSLCIAIAFVSFVTSFVSLNKTTV